MSGAIPLMGGRSMPRRPRFIIRPGFTLPPTTSISRHRPDLCRPGCSTSCCAAPEKHATKVDAMPARPAFAAPGAEVTDELHGDNIGAALAHGVIQGLPLGVQSLLSQRRRHGSAQYGNDGDGGHTHSHQQRIALAGDCLLLGGIGWVDGGCTEFTRANNEHLRH
jgi:hypothetical protein